MWTCVKGVPFPPLKMQGGILKAISETGDPYEIPWTAPALPTVSIGSHLPSKRPLTQAEEIFEEVKEWYRAQGKGVPVADAKACLDMIKAEKKEPEPEEPRKPRTVEEALGPKPMWGDPLFWDYWRKAKALGFTNDKKKKK